ncbi:MAG TPA: Hsp20/alpha crystallin family protein [Chryseolinea sp.]|nr:Hsp20/alpha crystallin family protein [Chryseolinea sp.]
MKKKDQYFELLTSVDVMNTLNGGRTEPKVKLSQLVHCREIRVKIPGIDSAGIEVEVNNDHVSIFYMMDIESAGKMMHLPYAVYDKQQPYYIDVSKINATVEGGELVVKLPFNELANGYHKKINTKE